MISNIKEEIFGGKKIGRLNYEQQIKDQALMLINDIDNNVPTKDEDFETLKQLYIERVDVVDKENLEYNKIKQYFQNKNICYTKITNHVFNEIITKINNYNRLTDENKKEEALKDLNYTFKEHFQTADKNKQYSVEFIKDCYRKYNDYFPSQELVNRFASVWNIRTQSGEDSVYDVLKSESRILRVDEINELKRLISKQKKNKSFDASEMFLKLNKAAKVLHLNLKNGLNYYIDRDSDDEILDPSGFDLSYFMKNGFINWHHQTNNSPESIIGEPTVARITDKGLYVEGTLYNNSRVAKEVYELAKGLESSNSNRRLGFSIEGKVLERDLMDK